MIPNTESRKYWTRHQHREGERTRNCLCIYARAFSGLGVIFFSPITTEKMLHTAIYIKFFCRLIFNSRIQTCGYCLEPCWYIKPKGSTDCFVSNLLVPYSPNTFPNSYPAQSLHQWFKNLFEKQNCSFPCKGTAKLPESGPKKGEHA